MGIPSVSRAVINEESGGSGAKDGKGKSYYLLVEGYGLQDVMGRCVGPPGNASRNALLPPRSSILRHTNSLLLHSLAAQVRLWPAWKFLSQCNGNSLPGTPILFLASQVRLWPTRMPPTGIIPAPHHFHTHPFMYCQARRGGPRDQVEPHHRNAERARHRGGAVHDRLRGERGGVGMR